MASLDEKYRQLKEMLKDMDSVLIGFSGGVDSTFLLKVACGVLGGKVLAATAYSATMAPSELELAKELAASIGSRHILVEADELKSDDFVANPPERCYYCKKTRFSILGEIQARHGLRWMADGTNADDEGDWRPGIRAADEMGIRSPLKEVGLSKDEIRELSASLGLSTWDKPSMPCLASRIPYGQVITEEKLHQIAQAEEFLQGLGFTQVRVRHHGDVARVEVPQDDFVKIIEQASEIVLSLKQHGFHFVALDLSDLKSGSMNVVLYD